ncbi:uncharacterized protein CG4449 isoform X1 [Pieris brassicae]|uniref:uncharacterized protein CG4449 isoform X1 n=1 Tax=Pieris brassicae TaxID=7116 RepID=UPI001E65EB6E|nr:uncharacterized protein CG4449 isoform X1 [Pieris brassicae]
MSSSDSEDDYYGNATKKLQNLINNYSEDKIDTVKLLKDINPINVQPVLEASGNNAVNTSKTSSFTPIVETEISKDDSLYEDNIVLDQIIACNSFRKTSSKTKNRAPPKQRGQKTRRGRRCKSKSKLSKDTQNNTTDVLSNNFNVAGLRRSIAQRNIGHHSLDTEQNRQRNLHITYSVGNTDEYPDFSDNIQLFNTKPLTREVEELFDDNEEQSVKVYWRSSEIVKFTIRKFQKILQIFEFFANKENVTINKLLFTYNDSILKPDDTPDKIDYNITKFIEGGLTSSVPIILDSNEEFGNGLKLKFQCQNVKKPFIICVQKEEKLLQAMVKCAEHFEKPFNALKFVFDGDAVSGSMTPDELDLEGGECIDVKVVGL